MARRPLEDRLWEKVSRRGPDDCWPFSGAHHEDGYGLLTVWVGDRWRHGIGAHRVAYMVTHGLAALPEEIVRHTCDNPPCCNPAHLVLGSVAANVRDCIERRRHRYGLNPQPGIRNGRAKLSVADVREIRSLVAGGATKAAVARTYGVTDVIVGRISRREAWAHVD